MLPSDRVYAIVVDVPTVPKRSPTEEVAEELAGSGGPKPRGGTANDDATLSDIRLRLADFLPHRPHETDSVGAGKRSVSFSPRRPRQEHDGLARSISWAVAPMARADGLPGPPSESADSADAAEEFAEDELRTPTRAPPPAAAAAAAELTASLAALHAATSPPTAQKAPITPPPPPLSRAFTTPAPGGTQPVPAGHRRPSAPPSAGLPGAWRR